MSTAVIAAGVTTPPGEPYVGPYACCASAVPATARVAATAASARTFRMLAPRPEGRDAAIGTRRRPIATDVPDRPARATIEGTMSDTDRGAIAADLRERLQLDPAQVL